MHLFNTGNRKVSLTASLYGISCGWADSLPVPKPVLKSDDVEPVGWWNFESADGASVPDRVGYGIGQMDLAGTSRVSLGVGDAFALRVFGNSSSKSFSVNSSAINALDEWSLAFWLNFWWGAPSGPTLCAKGDQLSYLQLCNYTGDPHHNSISRDTSILRECLRVQTMGISSVSKSNPTAI